MPELPVTATRAHEPPSVRFQLGDHVAHLHAMRVYLTTSLARTNRNPFARSSGAIAFSTRIVTG
jgi:hypothetical protein